MARAPGRFRFQTPEPLTRQVDFSNPPNDFQVNEQVVDQMGQKKKYQIAIGLFSMFLIGLSFNGCARLVSSSMTGVTESVAKAVVNHDDPELVKTGIPA